MRQCCRCREWKDESSFGRSKSRKDGVHPECKDCRQAYRNANKEALRQKSRDYYATHREERIVAARQVRQTEAFKHRNWLYNEARCGRFPEGETPALLRQREWFLEYKRRNREKHLQYNQAWRAKNLAHSRAYHRNWQKRDRILNPGRNAVKVQNRKALRIGNGGSFTAEEWNALKAHYNFTCLCCGQTEPEIKLSPDHVIPLARGGRNDITNIQPLCISCNCSKNVQTIDYRPQSS